MTTQKTLKKRIRARMRQTGERHTQARDALLARDDSDTPTAIEACAIVLKVNQRSARIRIVGEDGETTFRTSMVWHLVPGHVVDVNITKRWTYQGDAYASGTVERSSIDVGALGLEPLPLEALGETDLREVHEPFEEGDRYAPLWLEHTRQPRPAYELHDIAWSGRRAYESGDIEDCPVDDAMDMKEMGDIDGARALLMEELHDDLRYLDAHVHLGNIDFDLFPEKALAHYELAIRIGALSLPADEDLVLPWGCINNRPYHRALSGYGQALWKLGREEEAEAVFERMLALNPPDHLGIRALLFAVRDGVTWEAWSMG